MPPSFVYFWIAAGVVLLTFCSLGFAGGDRLAQAAKPRPPDVQLDAKQLATLELKAGVAARNAEKIRQALADGADARTLQKELYVLVQHNEAELLKLLLKHGADANALPRDHTGFRLLHVAIETKRMEITEVLLSAGADPNAKHAWHSPGQTPLLMAIEQNDLALVQRLIKAGADSNLEGKWGQRPCDLARADSKRHRLLNALQEANGCLDSTGK